MRKILLCTLFLSSCVLIRDPGCGEGVTCGLPPAKQRQKIAFLEKKLKRAEKGEKEARAEVDRLSEAVREAQLALIRKEVEESQEQMRKMQTDPKRVAEWTQFEASTLFLKERELLHQIIQGGPSPSAFEAQVVLDRILEMITEFSNHDK